MPADWSPNLKHQKLADELGLDLAIEVQKFTDHHQAKGSLMADWDAAFNTWLRRAPDMKKANGTGQGRYPTADERNALLAERYKRERGLQ